MKIKLKAGKRYSICSCGLSQALPLCDNAHREFNATNSIEYKSVKITPESDTIIEVISNCWKLSEKK